MIHVFEIEELPSSLKSQPYVKIIFMTVSPILEKGIFKDCVQTVVLEEEVKFE
jgi:hypothetical protein